MGKSRRLEARERCFTLDYWKDGRWYVGRLREVPGVISQGRTLRELKSNIVDAYRMLVDKEPIQVAPGRFETTTIGIPL